MAYPEDVIFQLALKRYDEWNTDKRGQLATVSVVLALDGALIGILARIESSLNIYWQSAAIVTLLISMGFCLYAILAREFEVINPTGLYNDIRDNRKEIDNSCSFTLVAARTVDEIVKGNAIKLKKLWLYLNYSIAFLISALVFVFLSLL